jgi:hypothetical protein
MILEIKTHKLAYMALVIALISFVITFLHVWPDRTQQKLVALAMGVFYFFWGVIVHKRHNHISPRVVGEYFAVSVLAVSLLLLLLN